MREAFFIGDTEFIRRDPTVVWLLCQIYSPPNNEQQSAVIEPDVAAFGFLVLTDDRSNEDHMQVEAGKHLWVDLVDRFDAAGDNGFPAENDDLLDLLGKELPSLDATEVHEGVGLWNERSAESLRFVDMDVLVLRVHARGASTLLEVSKNV